jgi:hypothetical protein
MSAALDAPRRQRSAAMIAFYTQCRLWHGYLSAFSFLALIFFSATGILLNHPTWLEGEEQEPVAYSASISGAEIAAARRSADVGAALGLLAAGKISLLGSYASADISSSEAFLRYEGVKGASDVVLDLRSGLATAKVRKANAITVIDDLHRGKNVGRTWQALIDISAILILALSLVGYVLFFMLRFRLRVSLALTAASLAVMAGIFVIFVP